MTQLFFKASNFKSNVATHVLNDVQSLVDFEASAIAHWIFDKAETSVLTDMNGSNVLTLQGGAPEQPVFSSSGVQIPVKMGNALISNIYDEASESFTMACVLKLSALPANVLMMLFGALPTDGDGFGVFSQNTVGMGIYAGLRRGIAINKMGYAEATELLANEYFMTILSVDKLNKKFNVCFKSVGSETNKLITYTVDNVRSTNPLALGNQAYTSTIAGYITIAESMIFKKYMELEEIDVLASRTRSRCAKRGIIF